MLFSVGGARVTSVRLTVVHKQPPLFTLTCISSGGPVSDVDWLTPLGDRPADVSELNNTLTAQYTHTLNVSQIVTGGNYTCKVYGRYERSKTLRIDGK